MKVTAESIRQMTAQGFITMNQFNLLLDVQKDLSNLLDDPTDLIHEYEASTEEKVYELDNLIELQIMNIDEGDLIVIDEPTKNTFMHDYVYSRPLSMNGKDMNRAVYNAIITRRDISLYCKGITPRRGFKITDVKRYFEIKGTKDVLLDAFLSKYNWIFANS
jgi:hypothetical protein